MFLAGNHAVKPGFNGPSPKQSMSVKTGTAKVSAFAVILAIQRRQSVGIWALEGKMTLPKALLNLA